MAVMGPSPPLRSTPRSWAAGAAATSSNGSSVVRRALTKRHHMRGGAIAGTAVGVALGVLLLIFCLYPFVVHYLKRRKRGSSGSNTPFDPEAEIAAEPKEPDGQIERGQQRPSSDSSFRRHEPEPTRGTEPPGGQLGWATPRTFYNGAPPGQLGAEDGGLHGWAPDAGNYRVQAAPFPQLGCYDGEFAPPIEEDLEPGVLKGTSADYYSPSIPSEAFGMRTEPASMADVDASTRKSTRGSSLRHHLVSMFHHQKSSRDQTTLTITDGVKEEPILAQGQHGQHVESPTELTPVTTSIPAPPSTTKTPPEIQIPDSSFQAGKGFAGAPSPPACPPPGTVNPMDIMPASTETEHWYRTEQELYGSYELSPGKPSAKAETMADPAPYSLPTPRTSPQEAPIHTFMPLQLPEVLISPEESTEDTNPESDGQTILNPDGNSASYTSEHSPPFPAHGFTDASSLNTPSTQLDTPSPESGGSYEYRLSGSPQPGQQGAQSPRKGVYQCDEPGCHQVFDLSHKLKHHQRYHSKDHKCPYNGCGKGFGTKTHLQRHINDRHERKKKFHCSIAGCDYSRAGGKAFPRKDNWKRHMMKIHNIDQQRLPEPVEADEDMNGM